ncbi:MAG: site-2 protease family protein, partial [Candidatus Micrarchaeota archaeon]|nr:site-2 protease family protein [Candidatus Micrarchaeota archaeon]
QTGVSGSVTLDVLGAPVSFSPWLAGIAIVLLAGGLAATTMLSLVVYAIIITPAVLGKIASVAVSILTGTPDGNHNVPPPGGSPLLPGINLPFLEGVLALAVLLVVHEMSHGLLARISKIRLDSAGIVFFGLLPFGAFVEPDEKELDAVSREEQNRVLVAGSSANIFTALLAILLLIGFLGYTEPMRLQGYRVVDGPIPAGTILYSVNGAPYIGQNLSLSPNTAVTLNTSRGMMSPTTDAQGRIGIHLEYVAQSAAGFRFQYAPQWEWLAFVANLLGLVFALNVLVGIVNLLPIPLFDGHKLMVNGVNSKKVSDAISILAAVAFLLNFLPWLFK